MPLCFSSPPFVLFLSFFFFLLSYLLAFLLLPRASVCSRLNLLQFFLGCFHMNVEHSDEGHIGLNEKKRRRRRRG